MDRREGGGHRMPTVASGPTVWERGGGEGGEGERGGRGGYESPSSYRMGGVCAMTSYEEANIARSTMYTAHKNKTVLRPAWCSIRSFTSRLSSGSEDDDDEGEEDAKAGQEAGGGRAEDLDETSEVRDGASAGAVMLATIVNGAMFRSEYKK